MKSGMSSPFLGAGIGLVEQERRFARLARAPHFSVRKIVLETRLGTIDEKAVKMRKDASEIGGNLAEQSIVEGAYGDDHVHWSETRFRRCNAIAEGGDLGDTRAGEPGQEINDVNATASITE